MDLGIAVAVPIRLEYLTNYRMGCRAYLFAEDGTHVFGNPLTFSLMPQWCWHLCLSKDESCNHFSDQMAFHLVPPSLDQCFNLIITSAFVITSIGLSCSSFPGRHLSAVRTGISGLDYMQPVCDTGWTDNLLPTYHYVPPQKSCTRKCHVIVSSDPGSCHLMSTLLQPALAIVYPHRSYSTSKTWPSTMLWPIGFLLIHPKGGSATAQQNHDYSLSPLHNGASSSSLTTGLQELHTCVVTEWKLICTVVISAHKITSLVVSKCSAWSISVFMIRLTCVHRSCSVWVSYVALDWSVL